MAANCAAPYRATRARFGIAKPRAYKLALIFLLLGLTEAIASCEFLAQIDSRIQTRSSFISPSSGAMTWLAAEGTISNRTFFTDPTEIKRTEPTVETARLTDSSVQAISTVNPVIGRSSPRPLSIFSSTLPVATAYQSYSASLSGTGGQLPYQWNLSAGTLPMGFQLNSSSGLLTGITSASGKFSFGVRLVDASGKSVRQRFILTVNPVGGGTPPSPSLSILTSRLPAATANDSYSASLSASGGQLPYQWNLASGTLPTGFQLNSSSGLLTGTTSTSGNFSFAVHLADASGQSASQNLTLTANSAPSSLAVNPSSVVFGTVQAGTSQQQSATLTNTGGSSVTISQASATGTGFSINNMALPLTLTAGQSTSLIITFTPQSAGIVSGTATVASTASNPTLTISLSATANSPAATSGTISSTFFGMHIGYGATGYSTPTLAPIQIGAMGKPPGTNWEFVETARGSYNWNDLDSAVSYASAHRIPIFVSHENVPMWVTSDTSTCFLGTGVYHCPAPPSDENIVTACQNPLEGVNTTDCMWKEFLTSMVNRYKSTGIQTGCSASNPQCHGVIQMYEGWNEPGGLVMTIGEFVTFETDFLNTVKANDPGAQVCSPAFLPSFSLMNSFFANSGSTGLDCYDFHINEPTPEGQIADINQFNSILSSNGIDPSTATIYATEAGRWGDCSATLSAPLTPQAYIARIELLYWSNNVKRHYWYTYGICAPLTDQPTTATLAPAGIAYGNVEGWMVGATMSTPCSSNGTVWTCGLSRPNGYQALAVWDTAGNSAFPVPNQYIQYQDLTGHTYSPGGSVNIGPEPILLTNGVTP